MQCKHVGNCRDEGTVNCGTCKNNPLVKPSHYEPIDKPKDSWKNDLDYTPYVIRPCVTTPCKRNGMVISYM